MKTAILLIISAILFSISFLEKPGEINGTIATDSTHESIPFANVEAYIDSLKVLSTISDIEGNFILKPLAPGKYNIRVTCVGFNAGLANNVEVKENGSIDLKISMSTSAIKSNQVRIDSTAQLIREFESPLRKVTLNDENISTPNGSANTNYSIREPGTIADSYFWTSDKNEVKTDQFRIPNTDDEEYNLIVDNEFQGVLNHPLSTFSIDVDAASYSNIRRFLTQGSLPPKDAVRIEEMINYFSYDYPQPKDGEPFSINTEMSSCPWNEKHKLIQIGLNGKSIPTGNLPDNNLVFLIDVSGSMESPDKLPLLKQAFHLLVEQLRPQDRVAIVVYAGNAGLVLPSTNGNRKEKILSAIDNLEAGGSTAGGAGIQLAYKIAKENFIEEGNNRVILATDGDFNVGVSSDNELIRIIEQKRELGVFLTVLGFGQGNLKDAKMEQLADKGNGNFSYIDNIREANKVFVKEMGATLNTIAKDVKLQIEFNPAKVKAYRLVGYENRMLANEDFNDDKKDAGELGSGHTVTAMYEIIPAGSNEEVRDVDPLKYQESITTFNKVPSSELMTVKFRYKDPNGSTSKLIVHPLADYPVELNASSNNFRFAASVAEFGMLLRNSKFKGQSNYKNVLTLSNASKGTDQDGYRAEFIRLVETAELLSKGTARVEEK